MSDPGVHQPGSWRDRRTPQVGEVLCGVYRLDRVLGWGAGGIVYAAWHLMLGRPCAVKLLHPSFVDHGDVRERFRREALGAFKLNHPSIIRVIDFRENESGWPMIVMELLQGESLRQRLARGPLPLALTGRIYEQLCDAMSAAHARGIVHRDLKPENIFLARVCQPDGTETEVAKILDFGISKVTDLTGITATHVLLGSPSYMSPEQARGDARVVDARADIFSLGVILYECLTGRKAFVAADPEQKRQFILQGAIPSLRAVAPELPAALEAVLQRACAVDPADRFQSALELLADLRQALREAQELQDATQQVATPQRLRLPGLTVVPSPDQPSGASGSGAPANAPPGFSAAAPMERGMPPPPTGPPSGADTLIWPPPGEATPSCRSSVTRAIDGLVHRLRLPSGVEAVLRRAREAVRGHEAVLAIPLVFVLVLLVVLVLDLQDRGAPQRLPKSQPRIEIIDGQQDR